MFQEDWLRCRCDGPRLRWLVARDFLFGSILLLVADRAGRAQAKKAATANTLETPSSIAGLATPMPSSLPAKLRDDATLNIAPSAKPTISTRPVERSTNFRTLPGVAPNAMRMPNSRVRCA